MTNKLPEDFVRITNFIIDNIEGGFVNHPKDPGGATNMGITQRVARSYGYDGDMRHLPREKALDIYFRGYWQGKIMDRLPPCLAIHVYDTTINSGYSQAVKILQRAVGVNADGIVGPKTLQAVESVPTSEAILKFNIERMYFYSGLANYGTFKRGWKNRLLLLAKFL
jgi:lysozyme family protein